LKGKLPSNHNFQGGEKFILFKIGLSTELMKYESLERKPSELEAGSSSTLFPVRIELLFERNISCNLGFQGRDRLCLLQIGLLSEVEETLVSL
jgi:hypothetical protein